MIKINNYNFSTDILNIIEELRDECSSKGFNYFKEIVKRDKYLSVTCPYHKDGQEKRASAGFRLDNGYFSCFTCSEKHSLVDVIAYCLEISKKEALEWLKDNFTYIESEKELKLDFTPKKKEKKSTKYISNDEISEYRKFHPYMFKRKLSKEIIRKYDIGYDEKSDSIIFPNRDEKGNILFLAKRSVKGKFYNYPKGVDKPIYGLYELNRDLPNEKTVIITESMINCLTCRSWGYPALALNGTGSAEQLDKLLKLPYTTYVLALDGDEAGRKGTNKVIKKLKDKKFVYILKIPEGKDVNDLEKSDFEKLMKNKMNLTKYKKYIETMED